MEKLTEKEEHIFKSIIAARDVQDFIWGTESFMNDDFFDKDSWVAVFQKRVDKISSLNFDNDSWKIELRKRLLQQAALSIMALELLEKI